MKYKKFLNCKQISLPWYEVEVLSLDEQKKYENGNTKTTFTAKNIMSESTKQCVYWTDKKLNKGDILQIRGFKKADIFIVKELMRLKHAEN